MPNRRIHRLFQVTAARARLALRVPLDTEWERRNYRVSVVEGCLATFPIQVVATFAPVFAVALGASNRVVGLLYSVPFLLNTVALLIANRLLEGEGALVRVGQGTAFLHRFFSMLLAAAPWLGRWGVVWVLVLYSAASAAQAVSSACWQAFSSDMFPEDRRGIVFGTRAMFTGTIALLSVMLTGRLLDVLPYPFNFVAVFVAVGLVGFAAAYVYGLYRPAEDENSAGAKERPRLRLRGLLATETGKRFAALVLVLVVFSFGFQMTSALGTIYFVHRLSLPNTWIGLLTAIVVLFQVIGSRIWGQIGDRWGNGTVLLFSTLILGVQCILFTAVPSVLYLAVMQAAGGFALGGYNVASLNALFLMGDRRERPQLIVWFNVVAGLANFLAPQLGTKLLEWVELGWVFALAGLVRLLASGLMWVLARRGLVAVQGRFGPWRWRRRRRVEPPAA